MKEITDFRLFKKVCRKYWKRNATKSFFYHNGRKHACYWTDKSFASYRLTDPDMLDRDDVKRYLIYDVHEDEIDEFVKKIKGYMRRKNEVKFIKYNNEDVTYTGKLIGLLLMNNTVAYLVENEDNTNTIITLNHYTKEIC